MMNQENELQIIINQQSILSQKVGILLAVNALIISSIISGTLYLVIGASLSFWYLFLLFLLIPSLVSLFFNLYILFPNFKNNGNTKYFIDYADMTTDELKTFFDENKENTIKQIQANSKILKQKYNLFKHALAVTFFLLPYLFLLNFK